MNAVLVSEEPSTSTAPTTSVGWEHIGDAGKSVCRGRLQGSGSTHIRQQGGVAFPAGPATTTPLATMRCRRASQNFKPLPWKEQVHVTIVRPQGKFVTAQGMSVEVR